VQSNECERFRAPEQVLSSLEDRLIDDARRRTGARESFIGAKALVRTFLANIAREVAANQKVIIPGFGVFYLARRKARRVRDIRSTKIMKLPETRRLGFRASAAQKSTFP
jgi:nucleoid DNA-binding protein